MKERTAQCLAGIGTEAEIPEVAGVSIVVIWFDVVCIESAECVRPVELIPCPTYTGALLQHSIVAALDRVIALRRPCARTADHLDDTRHRIRAEERALGPTDHLNQSKVVRRQVSEIERGRRDERRKIPSNFPFDKVPGLSKEVIQRLSQVRPDTLGHALRIPGVTPAAVAVLSAYVGRFPATSPQ